MKIVEKNVKKSYGKRQGRIMFPTTHDITPEVMIDCMEVIEKLLNAGNEILIVSKPHEEVIREICGNVINIPPFKKQVLFRFTIGMMTDRIRKIWEPGAPDFWERYRALFYAHSWGCQTSVSMEPLMEPERLDEMIEAFDPVVTDAIWIGKMNRIRERVKMPTDPVEKFIINEEIKRIEEAQTDERIKIIYNKYKKHPKIKWKESYKSVLGLKLAEEAGEDN
jgi:DNA repair photolyase